ncbi:MAG: hypothetical protein ACMXYA_02875 [Candidatus Woesearchaeota archaeon]
MNINAYTRLQESQTYTDWKKDNPDFKLAHCFFMKDQKAQKDWHFGFINEKTEELINFIVGNEITFESHTELAKQPDQHVLPLDIDAVSVTLEEAEKKLLEVVDDENQGGVTTTIFLLQNIPMIGTVWNVTAVTLTWKTLNVKIDAQTGDIKLKGTKSLFDVKKSDDIEHQE